MKIKGKSTGGDLLAAVDRAISGEVADELLAALKDMVGQIAAYDRLHGENSCVIDDAPALAAIAKAEEVTT